MIPEKKNIYLYISFFHYLRVVFVGYHYCPGYDNNFVNYILINEKFMLTASLARILFLHSVESV